MTGLRQVLASLRPRVLRSKRGAIGVDLSLHQLHMVQLGKRVDGSITVNGRVSLDYDCSRDELLADPGRLKTLIAKGTALVISGNDGPAQWNGEQKRLVPIAQDAELSQQVELEQSQGGIARGERGNIRGTKQSGSYLQDTRGWGAIHVSLFGKRTINMLMADGSVKEFTDVTKDRLVNPGFAVPQGSEPEKGKRLYNDGTLELPREQVFSGIFLYGMHRKGVF